MIFPVCGQRFWQILAELDYSQTLEFWVEDKNKNRFILSPIILSSKLTPWNLLKNVFDRDFIEISPESKLGVTCKYPNNFVKATNDYLTIFGYAEESRTNPLEELTAAEVGAEPAGAAAIALSDAKAYTDTKIGQLPPPPTLADLGGEPAGSAAMALNDAISYTNERISISDWQPLNLQNGWLNYGSPHPEAKYCIFSSRFCVLRGLIKSGQIGTSKPIALLPPGFRPEEIFISLQLTNLGLARIDVYPHGEIIALPPTPNTPQWLTINTIFRT